MKINLTFDVSDDLRRIMAQSPEAKITTGGLATRETVTALLQAKMLIWNEGATGFATPKAMTEEELQDYEDAVRYLKATGKTDIQIKRWIFKQRARRDFIDARL
jgi:hypothetical protein